MSAAEKPATRTCTGALMRLVQTLRSIQMSRGHHPLMLLNMTLSQLKAVMLLAETGGLRGRDLADRLGIAPPAVTQLVDRLVDQKLARREDDAEDRRIVWIRPTPRALAIQNELLQTNERILEEIYEELPAGQRKVVHESIRLLVESAERVLARK